MSPRNSKRATGKVENYLHALEKAPHALGCGGINARRFSILQEALQDLAQHRYHRGHLPNHNRYRSQQRPPEFEYDTR